MLRRRRPQDSKIRLSDELIGHNMWGTNKLLDEAVDDLNDGKAF